MITCVLREAAELLPMTLNPYVALITALDGADAAGRLRVVDTLNRAFGGEWRQHMVEHDIGQWAIAFELAALMEDEHEHEHEHEHESV